MEYPKKDIIKEITDLFEDYEETYVPGEWEEFSARKNKKYPFYISWLSAAAVVLMISSVVFFSIRKETVKMNVQFSAVKPTAPKNTPAPVAKDTVIKDSQHATRMAVQHVADHIAVQQREKEPKAAIPAAPEKQTKEELAFVNPQLGAAPGKKSGNPDTSFKGQKNRVIAKADVQPVITNVPVPEKETKAKKSKLSMMDFLAQESKSAEKAAKKKDTRSKWDFGVQVTPSSTGANVNFGGGISTAYRISDQISVSSGVSVLQLQAGKDISSAPVHLSYAAAGFSSLSPEISPDRKQTAVATNIRAIDMPVGVIYKVSKSFYTSAGVSLFNVLSEKRSNTYYQTSQVDKMTVNPETGFVSTYKSLQTTEIMENAPGISVGQDHIKQNNTLGFFNFSIGRQQNIFDKYSIQIEPFIKVPFGKFSTDNLNLLNSGIKFQLIF